MSDNLVINKEAEDLVIGFGKGGKTLAGELAKRGHQVILVEQSEKLYGGRCINIACIPTKAMVVSAEQNIPYASAIKLKEELTSFLRKKNYDAVQDLDNAEVLDGKASFLNDHQVKVTDKNGSEYRIEARKIFICTGSVPKMPLIDGLSESKRIYTSTSLLERSELPRKLVIVGGGFIAIEFASMYARYGSDVTLLNRSEEFLPDEDSDISEEIEKIFIKKNIKIRKGTSVYRIEAGKEFDKLAFIEKGIENMAEADAILIATGKSADLDGLDIENAGLQLNEKGFIQVDKYLKTNIPHIWALGDINGGTQFTYISLDDARIIGDQIWGEGKRNTLDRKLVAHALFLTPVFAHVGLRERDAKKQGLNYLVKSIPAGIIPRTRILKETDGLLKMIIDRETDQILGCSLLCAEAHEIINLVRLAMLHNVSFTHLKNEIYTHPSMSESFNYFP